MENKKAILIIMDGWGIGSGGKGDAIAHSKTPFINTLYKKYPHATLRTCGEDVGLPEGQMGNSEVGHLNLGAGRIVYQELQRINNAIKNGSLAKNSALIAALNHAKQNNKKLHLLGLVSDGGVHSHINHLKALLSICNDNGLKDVFVHAFTDGRDTDPKSGFGFIKEVIEHAEKTTGQISTITGRYYAMDRDRRWERVKVAYDAMVNGIGTKTENVLQTIQAFYDKNITDEFLTPIINSKAKNGNIENDDVVICFNFRTDRCREITEALTQHDFTDAGMKCLRLYYCTMTEYDQSFKNVHTFFQTDNLDKTLGEVISETGKRQLRIAETEKYPHVSFFFSGGREIPFKNEDRIMVPSPKVATYDLQPEMSAFIVTEKVIDQINSEKYDFICLNFANADMVGHTGVWNAVVKAVETVDQCVEKIVKVALEHDYALLITADHGNADYIINEDGSPNTAHTKNVVPIFLVDNYGAEKLKDGILGNVAPTILQLMGIPKPDEMSCESLIVEF